MTWRCRAYVKMDYKIQLTQVTDITKAGEDRKRRE